MNKQIFLKIKINMSNLRLNKFKSTKHQLEQFLSFNEALEDEILQIKLQNFRIKDGEHAIENQEKLREEYNTKHRRHRLFKRIHDEFHHFEQIHYNSILDQIYNTQGARRFPVTENINHNTSGKPEKIFKRIHNSNFKQQVCNAKIQDFISMKKISRRKSHSPSKFQHKILQNQFARSEFRQEEDGLKDFEIQKLNYHGKANPYRYKTDEDTKREQKHLLIIKFKKRRDSLKPVVVEESEPEPIQFELQRANPLSIQEIVSQENFDISRRNEYKKNKKELEPRKGLNQESRRKVASLFLMVHLMVKSKNSKLSIDDLLYKNNVKQEFFTFQELSNEATELFNILVWKCYLKFNEQLSYKKDQNKTEFIKIVHNLDFRIKAYREFIILQQNDNKELVIKQFEMIQSKFYFDLIKEFKTECKDFNEKVNYKKKLNFLNTMSSNQEKSKINKLSFLAKSIIKNNDYLVYDENDKTQVEQIIQNFEKDKDKLFRTIMFNRTQKNLRTFSPVATKLIPSEKLSERKVSPKIKKKSVSKQKVNNDYKHSDYTKSNIYDKIENYHNKDKSSSKNIKDTNKILNKSESSNIDLVKKLYQSVKKNIQKN